MCCGRKGTGALTSALSAAKLPPPNIQSGPAFEYVGRTGLTVVGRLTGMRYRFDGRGTRVQVHPRDAQGLEGIPVLRRLP